jgi:Na+(H+)/acetate symporter ActP
MSAFLKIPMQFGVLFIGVMVFVFYQFVQPPMIFNKAEEQKMLAGANSNGGLVESYKELQKEFDQTFTVREKAAHAFAENRTPQARADYLAANQQLNDLRKKGIGYIKTMNESQSFNDTNYVFPSFVTTYLPAGVVGLIIAAIFAAAMSSISAELSALSTATVIDFYRRHINTTATDAQYLRVAKISTGLWGIFACVVALYASRLGSLIEVVNKFGSYFYGSLLGVFMLALGTKRATGTGAFVGLFAGIASVALVSNYTNISFLWYNLVGCVAVFVVGMIVSLFTRKD